jgi:hypothetical protein
VTARGGRGRSVLRATVVAGVVLGGSSSCSRDACPADATYAFTLGVVDAATSQALCPNRDVTIESYFETEPLPAGALEPTLRPGLDCAFTELNGPGLYRLKVGAPGYTPVQVAIFVPDDGGDCERPVEQLRTVLLSRVE